MGTMPYVLNQSPRSNLIAQINFSQRNLQKANENSISFAFQTLRRNHRKIMKNLRLPKSNFCNLRGNLWLLICLSAFCSGTFSAAGFRAAQERIKLTPNFGDQEILPNEKIELKFNRSRKPHEGKFIAFINETDISALLSVELDKLVYAPSVAPLPEGENHLQIYLAATDDDWQEIGNFTFKVKLRAAKNDSAPSTEEIKKKKTNVVFLPQMSLNLKGENTVAFFPQTSAPERERFTDANGQASFNLNVSRRGWNLNNRFDFVGASRGNEALRFGELGRKAAQVDLSGYLVELEKDRFKFQIGHVSFGSSRHLVNSFTSRGLNLNVPLTSRDEISFGFVNGTSVVGFNNFIGISRVKHSVGSVTYGREFFKEKGKLRVETTFLRGSLLPLTNFNEGAIVDTEKSFGGTIRVKRDVGRLRLDSGFTRSRFTNPADPQLEQGFDIAPVRAVTRNAGYAEISFDFIKSLKVSGERALKLTGTYRFEELQPLFRSIAASTQADRRQHQFELVGSLGDINIVYGNLRDRDNLRDVPSILKTLNRNDNLNINFSLGTIFNQKNPSRLLPRIGYVYAKIHQFGAFPPILGDFREFSQVPDQFNFNHNFAANWEFSDKFGFSYQHQRGLIDNRQPGRERADADNLTHSFNFDYKPLKNLNAAANLSWNRVIAFEEPRTDETFNLSSIITWSEAIFKNSTATANFATTLAGDAANLTDSRNGSLSLEWSYKRTLGKESPKKMEAQFFIRYNNTYGGFRDNVFFINNINKRQTFNFGLNFNFF